MQTSFTFLCIYINCLYTIILKCAIKKTISFYVIVIKSHWQESDWQRCTCKFTLYVRRILWAAAHINNTECVSLHPYLDHASHFRTIKTVSSTVSEMCIWVMIPYFMFSLQDFSYHQNPFCITAIHMWPVISADILKTTSSEADHLSCGFSCPFSCHSKKMLEVLTSRCAKFVAPFEEYLWILVGLG